MPRQLREVQAFPELPRHFRKCRISANACDMYICVCGRECVWERVCVSVSVSVGEWVSEWACVCGEDRRTEEERKSACVWERGEKNDFLYFWDQKKKETIKNRKSFRKLHLIKLLLPKKDENEMKKLLERICIFFYFIMANGITFWSYNILLEH